jgi:hypothetical protein
MPVQKVILCMSFQRCCNVHTWLLCVGIVYTACTTLYLESMHYSVLRMLPYFLYAYFAEKGKSTFVRAGV